MNILYKLLACFFGIVIFIAIIGSCEQKTYKENRKREARLNYEMYFNAVAESCMENSDFYNKLSENMKIGHLHNCPACNFGIVSQYIHNENWDDTVGELSEYDNIDGMIVGYLNLMKDDIIECNHNHNIKDLSEHS